MFRVLEGIAACVVAAIEWLTLTIFLSPDKLLCRFLGHKWDGIFFLSCKYCLKHKEGE